LLESPNLAETLLEFLSRPFFLIFKFRPRFLVRELNVNYLYQIMLFLKKNSFFGLHTIPIELETWYFVKMSLGRIYMLEDFQNNNILQKSKIAAIFCEKQIQKYKKMTDFGENFFFKIKCCDLCRIFLYFRNKRVFKKIK